MQIPEHMTWRHVAALLIMCITLIIILLIVFAPLEWWMELVR